MAVEPPAVNWVRPIGRAQARSTGSPNADWRIVGSRLAGTRWSRQPKVSQPRRHGCRKRRSGSAARTLQDPQRRASSAGFILHLSYRGLTKTCTQLFSQIYPKIFLTPILYKHYLFFSLGDLTSHLPPAWAGCVNAGSDPVRGKLGFP